MKKLLFFILLCSVVSAQEKDSINSSFGKQVITKEDIEHSGVARLSDLFQLINSSAAATIDGYRWQTSINYLTPDWGQDWKLYIDGQEVDIDIPYMKNINLIPLSVADINYLEVTSLPGIEQGSFYNSGVIHIHTVSPPDGLSINASLASANEIGDPGPFKYTDPQSPNIDQVGPYYWASIKWGSTNFKLQLGLKHHLQIYTDPNINNRFIGYPWEFRQLRMTGASLKIDIDFAGSHNSIFVSRTETGDPYLFQGYGSDLLFFKPAGKEFPTESKHTHAGLNGNFIIGSNVSLNYKFKFSSSLLDWTLAPVNNVFDWNLNNFDGVIELESIKETSQTKLSVGINHVKLITHYDLQEDSFTLFRINGQTGGINTNALQQLIYGGVVLGGNRSALKAGTRLEFYVNKDVTVNANISYSTKLPEEKNDLWFWVNQGYGFLNDFNIPYQGDNEQKISRQITGDVEFLFEAGDDFNVSIGGFYRKFMDYYLERQSYTYDSSNELSGAATLLSNSENGTVAGVNVNIASIFSSTLKQELFYQYNPYYAGSDLFYEGWESFPQHKLKLSLDYSPVSSFSMRGMVTYLSETYWLGYINAADETDGFVNHVVEGNLLIDLAVRKTFGEDRIRATLLLQNMLGNFARYHPVGALFDMTVFMKLEVMLDSIL